MLAKLHSYALLGINCLPVEVEVGLSGGLPKFTIVGLGDAAVQEARERVRLALIQSGFQFPRGKITVNLAPADLKKAGPSYDLPIALGILIASRQIPPDPLSGLAFVGELALEGRTRHVNGILALALAAAKDKRKGLVVPSVNAIEAALVHNLPIYSAPTLKHLTDFAQGKKTLPPHPPTDPQTLSTEEEYPEDMSYIRGQEHAKRALEIAAAGSHNVLMNGAPGAGKTLLARTFRTILPRLTHSEALNITKIYSIAGHLPSSKPLITSRPFRSVHHTASAISIVGGGTNPSPGEISLAHKGVLFLDEIAEFPSAVLEVLRQPLEDHQITVSRASGTFTFPAQFTLIAAMNPCPCGFYNVPNSPKPCTCSPAEINRYQKKISGPLLDRIDLYVDVPPVHFDKLTGKTPSEPSTSIRARVQAARDLQTKRFSSLPISSNSEMTPETLKKVCPLTTEQKEFLRQAMRTLQLSARSFHRILKLSRTIADLANSETILTEHLAEALQYRPKIIET